MTSTRGTHTEAATRRRANVWAAGLLGLLALLILTMTVRSAAAGPSVAVQRGPAGAQDKPTIVLVHGAWADSSSWSPVVRRLQRHGYTVHAPANPLRGLSSDAAYLSSYLHTISGPVVLVGHSYGGAVTTNAATGNPAVKALVFVDAFAPDEGETIVQLATAQPGSAIGGDPTTVFDPVPIPGASGDVDLYVKKSIFADAFANDLPPRTAAVLGAVQRPIAFSALVTPSGAPAWETIPSWYLVGTEDHIIPAAEQRLMAARAHAHTVEISASHLAMISHPGPVTRLIIDAAKSVR